MAEQKNLSGLRGLRFPGLVHDGYFQRERVDGEWRRSVIPFKTDPQARERLLEFARKHGLK